MKYVDLIWTLDKDCTEDVIVAIHGSWFDEMVPKMSLTEARESDFAAEILEWHVTKITPIARFSEWTYKEPINKAIRSLHMGVRIDLVAPDEMSKSDFKELCIKTHLITKTEDVK